MTGAPRPDPYLLSRGERAPDLSRIAGIRPFRLRGPVLDRNGVALLRRLADGPVAPDRLAAAERVQWDLLEQAELVDGDGAATRFGAQAAARLAAPELLVTVQATEGRAAYSLHAYGREGTFVLVATPSPASAADRPPAAGDEVVRIATSLGVDLVHGSWLPVEIASWLGVTPAWSLATSPAELPEALVRARIEDPGTPPPADADDHLREVWRQPWLAWTLVTGPGRPGLAMVAAGARGHYSLEPAGRDGVLLFAPVPSQALWLAILDRLA